MEFKWWVQGIYFCYLHTFPKDYIIGTAQVHFDKFILKISINPKLARCYVTLNKCHILK
jgi:hypothetical protein